MAYATFAAFLADLKAGPRYANTRFGSGSSPTIQYLSHGQTGPPATGSGPSANRNTPQAGGRTSGVSMWDRPAGRYLGPGDYDFNAGRSGASTNEISAARGNTMGGGGGGQSRSGISNDRQGRIGSGFTPEEAEKLKGVQFVLRLPQRTISGTAEEIFAQIYDMRPAEITALQQMLWNGYLYPGEMYANGVEPGWGSLFDAGATRDGIVTIMLESASSGKSLNQVLEERANTYQDEVGLAGQQRVEPSDPVYAYNPEQIITLADPDQIADMADQVAFRTLGRKATKEEKLIFIQMTHAQMRLLQTQQAQVNLNTILGQAQASAGQGGFLIQPGNTGGYVGSAGPQGGGGGLVHPIAGMRLEFSDTGDFGPRRPPTAGASSNHMGVDIGAPEGTPIVAATGGTVIRAERSNRGGGNQVYIRGADGRIYKYLHMTNRDFGRVKVGQTVAAGEMIGRVGSTGTATGAHLHFGIFDPAQGQHIDPEQVLRGGGGGRGNPEAAASWLRAAAAYGVPAGGGGGGGDFAAFVQGIKDIESRGGDYNARNPSTGAWGAYQFLEGTWKRYAALAGANPNDRSPANQDRVAHFNFRRLYNTYGSWRMVAIAWHGGEGTANAFVRNPSQAARDNPKTNNYANEVLAATASHGGTGAGPGAGPGGMEANSLYNQEYGQSTQDWNPRLVEQVDYNMETSIEAEMRRRNPGLAGAHDVVVHGWDYMKELFAQPSVSDQ